MNHIVSTSRIALLILVLCVGPASAERPQPQPQPLTGAFDPETLLLQLEQLVKNRDWKTYGTYLSPGFRFIPYASLWVEYPTMEWDLWGKHRELDFIQEMVAPHHRASLNLLDNVLDPGLESHGRAEWDLVYTLVSRGMVFQSRAIFVFEEVDNLWYLREWVDTTIENDPESGADLQTSGSLREALSR